MPFSVQINGEETAGGGASFRYMNTVHVISLSPRYGSVDGGDVVVLSGLRFAGTDDAKCVCGGSAGTSTAARVLSSTAR